MLTELYLYIFIELFIFIVAILTGFKNKFFGTVRITCHLN